MKKNRKDRIAAVFVAVAFVLCLCAVGLSGTIDAAAAGVTMEYESELFNTDEPITVNFIVDEDDWQNMLDTAINEEYLQCDVEVNGEIFYGVGVRPKGNTSLSSIANNPDTDRYSFKVEFDHYADGQTCYGLDKLVLNNNYADATCMKEALVYEMYQILGADASLYNYATISVNGEYWGTYLALEAVEDSFLLRNYGVSSGELYKPEGMGIGGGGGGASFGGGGADLNYTDDDPDSYETIWEGAQQKTSDKDKEKVITALSHAADGTDLDEYLDIDNLLRYMAVHVFVVNQDSLSGNMAHNYYLYEDEGKLNLIPWDYNLAFGGMGAQNASSIINDDIADPFDGTDFFDQILADETYRAQYETYLSELCDLYGTGDETEHFIEKTRANIDSGIETDPTAFYTYDEYEAAVETLLTTVTLRAEAVQSQLDGSTEKIDTGDLDLSIMGTMDMGNGGFGGGMHDRGGRTRSGNEQQTDSGSAEMLENAETETQAEGNTPQMPGGQMPGGNAQQGGDPPQMPDGEQPANGDEMPNGEMPTGGFGGEKPDDMPELPNGEQPAGDTAPTESQTEEPAEEQTESEPQAQPTEPTEDENALDTDKQNPFGDFDPADFDGEMPDMGDFKDKMGEMGGMPGMGGEQAAQGFDRVNLAIYGGCLVLLLFAIIFVKLYRRRSYPKVKK